MTDVARYRTLLLKLVRGLPRVQVQNRLMACTDRDVALAIDGMEDADEAFVLDFLSGSKAVRVRDEKLVQAMRRVDSRHTVAALVTIISSLEANRAVAGQRSYLRPRRPRSRN